MKLARITVTVLVFSLIAGAALAQPPGGGRGRGGQFGGVMALASTGSPISRLTAAIDKLDLTSDQKEKIADLKKEYEPKFKELRGKMTELLTDDQKKALKEGQKKIQEATDQQGRREAMQDLRSAVTLTSDQQAKMREIGRKVQPLVQEATQKLRDVLTDEQKTKLQELMPNRGGRRGGRGGGNNQPQAQST